VHRNVTSTTDLSPTSSKRACLHTTRRPFLCGHHARCVPKAVLLRVCTDKRYGERLSYIFEDRYPMTVLFVSNGRNALALVEYHHGAVPAILDELGAASATVWTIPRYDLIIRRIYVHITLGRYFSAAFAFDFHFVISTPLVSFCLSLRPQLRRLFSELLL
jgi:hypothetical protein